MSYKKNSLLKKIVSPIVSIIILCSLTSAVCAMELRTGGMPYNYTPFPTDTLWGWFCFQLSTPTNFYDYVSGVPEDEDEDSVHAGFKYTDFELIEQHEGDIEPSVGYAMYYVSTHSIVNEPNGYPVDPRLNNADVKHTRLAFQHVLWASQRWGNESNVYGTHIQHNSTSYGEAKKQGIAKYDKIEDRATDFGNVYYYVTKPLQQKKTSFTVTPATDDQDSLDVLVNQADQSYTVGPYKISLNITPDMIEVEEWAKDDEKLLPTQEKIDNAKNTLYDELTNPEKIKDKARFAWSDGVEGINGKNVKYLNANGEEIAFPDFRTGEEFYIRFNDEPSNDGIYEIGNPNIKVNFIDAFNGQIKVWAAKALIIKNLKIKVPQIHIHREAEENLELDLEASIEDDFSSIGHYHCAIVAMNDIQGDNVPSKGYDEWIRVDASCTLVMKFKWTANFRLTEDMIGTVDSDKYGRHTITWEMVQRQKDVEIKGFYSEEEIKDVKVSRWVQGTPHYSTGTNPDGTTYKKFEYYTYDATWNHTETPWHVTDASHTRKDSITTDVTFKEKEVKWIQPIVEIIPRERDFYHVDHIDIKLATARINMQIGGLVWIEQQVIKGTDANGMRFNGRFDNGESPFKGILVQLFELEGNGANAKLKAETTTDADGRYRFYGITGDGKPLVNAMKDYFVRFFYNGEMYQYTYYKKDLSGGYSNAKDIDRASFNDIFDIISSYNENYRKDDHSGIAYAKYQRLEKSNHEFIAYNEGKDETNPYKGALTFIDVWNQFLEYACFDDGSSRGEPKNEDNKATWKRSKNYDAAYTQIYAWMLNKGVSETEARSVVQYIKDIQNIAYTYVDKTVLPFYDQFVIKNINKDSAEYQADSPKVFNFGGIDYTYLYNKTCDQARNVDFGLYERDENSISLIKDIFKATVKVNGKEQDYFYQGRDNGATELQALLNNYTGANNATALSQYLTGYAVTEMDNTYMVTKDGKTYYIDKTPGDDGKLMVIGDNDSFNVSIRTSDYALNRNAYKNDYTYAREIRKSEYLYNENDAYGNNSAAKDLQVYVTYKIKLQNSGSYNVKIDEVVDHYDSKMYSFDGVLSGNTYTPVEYDEYDGDGNKIGSHHNTYAASSVDFNGNVRNQHDINIRTTSITGRNTKISNEYDELYLTGIKVKNNGEFVDYLKPGQFVNVFVTFKVNNNPETQKVWLDQSLKTGVETIGKRNIAEINQYETYYAKGAKIPENLNADGTGTHTEVTEPLSTKAGKVDSISNPGNLSQYDLDANGMIRQAGGDTIDPINDRTQKDASQAPNIKLIIDQRTEDNRTLSGYAYEDARNRESQKAVVGNGIDENETRIDGVTVELVEAIQEVDKYGTSTGRYLGEKVWESVKYGFTGAGEKIDVSERQQNPEDKTYYTGIGYSKIILQGSEDSILHVDQLLKYDGQGLYGFESVPAGDFYIRFIYGDTDRTVLMKGQNEVNNTLKTEGMNAISYNGQDYKSTTYQTGVDQNGISYKNVYGFTSDAYDTRNFTLADGTLNNSTNKPSMYYYDIARSEAQRGVSDAKDVAYYRTRSNNYSKGANGTTLLNNRAEILGSFYKLATYQSDGKIETLQRVMVNELERETQGVAQTGIINTEVEKNTTRTVVNPTDINQKHYNLDDIDLGLEQRPVAQLKITKEVANLKIQLSDGQVLFNTNQGVSGLTYDKHNPHIGTYKDVGSGRLLTGYKLGYDAPGKTPEIIQAQIDDEILEGSTLVADYRISVENIGEIDYKDSQFYYTGNTANSSTENVSKTNAKQIVDYVTNEISYIAANQSEDANWTVVTSQDLTNSNKGGNIDNDLVNREYYTRIASYNTLLTSKDLEGDLLPTMVGKGNNTKATTLRLSTQLTANTKANSIYNNMTELIETSNEQGRRMNFSIVGNEKMAKNTSDPAGDELPQTTRVSVTEIDADAAQKIVIMPPTGDNRNYTLIILVALIALGIIGAGAFGIKKTFNNKTIF